MKTIIAASGILRLPTGEVCITERPVGKIWAGYWEFPGGKLEQSETPEQAMVREMEEEIGITPLVYTPFRFLSVAREEHHVAVLCYLCTEWQGEPTARENQKIAWVLPEKLDEVKMLPSNAAIIQALKEVSRT